MVSTFTSPAEIDNYCQLCESCRNVAFFSYIVCISYQGTFVTTPNHKEDTKYTDVNQHLIDVPKTGSWELWHNITMIDEN